MRFGLLASTVLVAACGGSPYDRPWLDETIAKTTGHAPGKERPTPSTLPPGVRDVATLSAEDATATALWNSARFQVELGRLGLSRADLADAAAFPNPVLSFLLPMGTRQLEASATYPIGALLQRHHRIAAAKIDVERTAHALVEVALDLVRDVRVAHAELVLAEQRVGVRRELEETWSKVADLTDVRLRAGDASALEARTARAEAWTAKDASARAVRDVGIVKERLRRLLGLGESALGERLGVASAPVETTPLPAREALTGLTESALASRPDVRAAEIAVEAAGARLGLERAKILQLLARVDLKPIGSGGGPPSLYLPGAQIELPIFNWNPGGRDRAHAEMAQATLRYVAVREDVVTEVRVAHAQLEQAQGSLAPWRDEVLPLVDANVATAMRAYERGAETYLVVLESLRRAGEAKLRRLDLEADVWRSRAALGRAVGRRLSP